MALYTGSKIKYHLQVFRRANGTTREPRNTKKRYNHLHSSCRMFVERTFGVWKARLIVILTNMAMHTINMQTNIILATMKVHNYIRKSNVGDGAFQTAEQETYMPEDSTLSTNINRGESDREGNNDEIWNAKRDGIAASIK